MMKILNPIIVYLLVGGFEIFGFSFNSKPIIAKSRGHNLSMKIFDWKKREAFSKLEIPEDYKLSVNTIFAIPGSRKKFLRVGRGISAGQGKTCGRGMRGQNSRSGGGTRPGFEGGQTPLYRRIPKFKRPMLGHTRKVYELVKLDHLNELEEGTDVDSALLIEKCIVTKANKQRKIYKIVGGGSLAVKGLSVRAHAFTASAREAIESAGGSCILLSPTGNIPLDEALADALAKDSERLLKLKELRAMKAKRDAEKALV